MLYDEMTYMYLQLFLFATSLIVLLVEFITKKKSSFVVDYYYWFRISTIILIIQISLINRKVFSLVH